MTKIIKLEIDYVVRDGDDIVFAVNPTHVPPGNAIEVKLDPSGAPAIDGDGKMGRTIKPVIVTQVGMNTDTYEMEYRIVMNGEMAEAASLAGIETVDAFQIDEADAETVAKMF